MVKTYHWLPNPDEPEPNRRSRSRQTSAELLLRSKNDLQEVWRLLLQISCTFYTQFYW